MFKFSSITDGMNRRSFTFQTVTPASGVLCAPNWRRLFEKLSGRSVLKMLEHHEEENQTTTSRDCWAAGIWDSAEMDPDSSEKLQQSVSSVPKVLKRDIKGSWWNTMGNIWNSFHWVLMLQILHLVLLSKPKEAGQRRLLNPFFGLVSAK